MSGPSNPITILALDVGEKRIGVASARLDVRFAQPRTTLDNPTTFYDDIVGLCASEQAKAVVIGLPRGMNGQETAQTRLVREFGAGLESRLSITVYWIDEAVTSAQAEAELQARGKPYAKADVDALAATYILEDFMNEHPEALDV